MPDGTRQDGTRQKVYYLDPGKAVAAWTTTGIQPTSKNRSEGSFDNIKICSLKGKVRKFYGLMKSGSKPLQELITK